MRKPQLPDASRTPEIQAELDKQLRERHPVRLHERYQAIKMMLLGYRYDQIAEVLGRSITTITHYVDAFRQGGLAGLVAGVSPGRPTKLTSDQEQQLLDVVVHQHPADVGFPAEMNWTGPLVQAWIKQQFNVEYTERGVRALLYRLDLRWTQPTYVLAKADPLKQQAFVLEFDELKQALEAGQIDRILFQDESMIRDYQAIQRTWFPKGQQKRVPTYGKHWGAKLLGFLDYASGEVVVMQSPEKYDAEVFLKFLQQVVDRYPNERIVMILDNAKIHHAKLIQPFLEAHPQLHLVFLPPYSPNLNLIEGLWKWLKSSVINNVFFGTVKAIQAAVAEFLKKINKDPEAIKQRLCFL